MLHNHCGFLLLSEACNLQCLHCYVSASPGFGQHMSLEIVEAAFDFFDGIGIDDVRLTGGEPTVHPHFKKIVAMARSRRFRLGLVSNGVRLLNKPESRNLLGEFSRCWISLYGPSAEDHNRTAGRAARPFHQILCSVGELSKEGYPIGISAIIEPGAGERIGELIRLVAERGVRRLRILPVQPDGRMKKRDIDWAKWPSEIQEIARKMRTHPCASSFEVLTINDPFDLGKRFETARSSCLVRSRQLWSIVPNGDIYPCCFTVYKDGARVGHVLEGGIADRLHALFLSTHSGQPACEGLSRDFWQNADASSFACPIGSIDPRTLEARVHAFSG